MTKTLTSLLLAALAAEAAPQLQTTPEEQSKIVAAIPAKAAAKPKKPRKFLVVTLNTRDGKERPGHASLGCARFVFELMAKKTGAFEPVFSNDLSLWGPETLKSFDGVCFLNTTGVLTDDTALRESLLAFVRGGKGFVGIHAAAATFVQYPKYDQFPAFGEMLGGYEDGGHPWKPNETITLRVEDPRNRVNAGFPAQEFPISDEVFQFRAPYSRRALRVLLSIDTGKTDMNPSRRFLKERAADKDFPISWIRNYGKGRVFYSALGHNKEIYWNAPVLAHFLAGIQFALGDLKADATPSAKK